MAIAAPRLESIQLDRLRTTNANGGAPQLPPPPPTNPPPAEENPPSPPGADEAA
ncbi:MAG: hypothetical protein U0703_18780 [Anaerolineae bacterium]